MWLETEHVGKHFGGVMALDDVTLDFPPGMVTAIIGPNGAGKTTLLNVINGFQRLDTGSVYLCDTSDGKGRCDIAKPPHTIADMGIGTLFQSVRVGKLSVLNNVAVGVKRQVGESSFNCFFRSGAVYSCEKETLSKARDLVAYVGLADKAGLWAEQLSYGQQKLLAIARLLASDARVLLLDEPTSGVHPSMIDKLLDLIQRLASQDGRVIVMIEHNLNVVKRVGDWVYLMAAGRIEVFGKPAEVLREGVLREAFPTL